ncbi:MAG TPA: vWA domain-containing protein [Polyangiales bacterium]|nr:vWA domain-containing protein [Polyangiales bacterium]
MWLLLLAALAWVWSGCGEATPSSPRAQAGGSSGSGAPAASGGSPSIVLGEGSKPEIIPVAGQPAPPVDDCNRVEISFAPKVPSVFILVDRSSSMFERGLWNPLKEGVLAVIDKLDAEIRFGFSTYTGQVGQCPQLTTAVPLAKQNFDAIKRAYDAVTMPQFKGETPTSLAITEVAGILAKEPSDTPKYILLVTDGEPDFCDDPNVTCSRDAVVAAVQAAYAKGIGTFIVSVGGSVDPMHLRDVANAGTGQPVTDRQMAVHYQCPNSTATYSAESGSAPFFEPDVADRNALVMTLADTIAGVRSCVFDLQGKIAIDLKLQDQGDVQVDTLRVPYGPPDGYRMNSPTQLELLGGACQKLKQPETKTVSIDFPCEAVVLL